MSVKELLYKKYIYQGDDNYASGNYFDAYLSYRKAISHGKSSQLARLLCARALFQLNQYKRCFENLQVCAHKLTLSGENHGETRAHLQQLKQAMLKIMTPTFALPTIPEDSVLDMSEEDREFFSDTESNFNKSIEEAKSIDGFSDDNSDWDEEALPNQALVENDCTDDLLEEHLRALDISDQEEDSDDGWNSDDTLTAATLVDSDSEADTDPGEAEVKPEPRVTGDGKEEE